MPSTSAGTHITGLDLLFWWKKWNVSENMKLFIKWMNDNTLVSSNFVNQWSDPSAYSYTGGSSSIISHGDAGVTYLQELVIKSKTSHVVVTSYVKLSRLYSQTGLYVPLNRSLQNPGKDNGYIPSLVKENGRKRETYLLKFG